MIKTIYFFCALFVLNACTPQQRINKLLKKHPDLVNTINTTVIDTFITRSYHYDTLLKANRFTDTIVINKNNILTKFFYNYKTDSLYINNYVAADTIIKVITVPGKAINVNDNFKGLKYWFVILLVILFLLGIFKALRK